MEQRAKARGAPPSVHLFSDRVHQDAGSGAVFEPRHIVVRSGQIAAVEPATRAAFQKERAEALGAESSWHDLGEWLVVPSFINAHTHLAMSALRGIASWERTRGNVVCDTFFRVESQLSAEDVRAFARVGALECLLNGIGEVWDHYYFGLAVAEALQDVGLAGVVAPTLQDLAGPGKKRSDAELEATSELAAATGRGGVFAALGPHAPDTVSSALLSRSVELAQTWELPLHMHVAQSFGEYEAVLDREGQTPMSWLFERGVYQAPHVLLAHAIFASAAEFRGLPENVTFLHCPYSQASFCFEAHPEVLECEGVRFAIGTDAVASNDSHNLQKELRRLASRHSSQVSFGEEYSNFLGSGTREAARAVEAARAAPLRGRGPEPSELLRHVWEIPGRMHPAFRSGTLAKGARANLLVIDGSHPSFWPGSDPLRTLCYGDTALAIKGMLVGGNWVGRLGDFHNSLVDSDLYRDVLGEARGRRDALLARTVR